MLALIFYVVVAFAIALLWDRLVRPLSVAAIIVMMAMPLCFTGRAMFTGRVFAPADIGFLAPPLEDYARDYGVVDMIHGQTETSQAADRAEAAVNETGNGAATSIADGKR